MTSDSAISSSQYIDDRPSPAIILQWLTVAGLAWISGMLAVLQGDTESLNYHQCHHHGNGMI